MIPEFIVIEGTRQGNRYIIRVDQRPIPLQPICFRFFAIFGIQLLLGEEDGWVRGSAIYEPQRLIPAYIYRLKQNVHSVSERLQFWRVVENDKQGRYRLIARPESVVVDYANVRDFSDHDLELMVDKLMSMKNSVAE